MIGVLLIVCSDMNDEVGIPEVECNEVLLNRSQTKGSQEKYQDEAKLTDEETEGRNYGDQDDERIPELDFTTLLKDSSYLRTLGPVLEQKTRSLNEVVNEFYDGFSGGGSTIEAKGSRRMSKKHEPQIIHLLKKVDLETTVFCIVIPLFSLFYIIFAPPAWNKSLLRLGVVYYILTQLSIVAGYHRFFTHQSYHCHLSLQFFMAILGASCGFGSIRKFSARHLAHHRYLDTEKDPQNLSIYGWWFAQWGHMLFRGNRKSSQAIEQCGKILSSSALASYAKDQKSLQLVVSPNYSLLKWQEKNYYQLWVLTNLIIPGLAAKFICNISLFSCIFYMGLVRMSVIQQQWLVIGSFCHLKNLPFSSQPYDDSKSAINFPLSFLSQIITFGESNHNFHHEFPGDYRNGASWYNYDPAKWAIKLWNYFGLAQNLHTASNDQFQKAKIQQQQKIIDEQRSKLQWGIPIDKLPIMTPEYFSELAKKCYEKDKKALVAIEDIVHDVTPFINDHPGGLSLVVCAIGKDATPAFNGAVYEHSTAARNLLATMRVAKLSRNVTGIHQTHWDKSMLNDSKGQRIVRNRNQATFTRINHHAAGAA